MHAVIQVECRMDLKDGNRTWYKQGIQFKCTTHHHSIAQV